MFVAKILRDYSRANVFPPSDAIKNHRQYPLTLLVLENSISITLHRKVFLSGIWRYFIQRERSWMTPIKLFALNRKSHY